MSIHPGDNEDFAPRSDNDASHAGDANDSTRPASDPGEANGTPANEHHREPASEAHREYDEVTGEPTVALPWHNPPHSRDYRDHPTAAMPTAVKPTGSSAGSSLGMPARASMRDPERAPDRASSGLVGAGYSAAAPRPGEAQRSYDPRRAHDPRSHATSPGTYGQPGADYRYGRDAYGRPFGQPMPRGAMAGAVPAAPASSGKSGPSWGAATVMMIAAIVIATVLGAGISGVLRDEGPRDSSALVVPTANGKPVVTSTTNQPDWANVASVVGPSVVAITVREATGTAVGSGVVYDDQGHIVTNDHVVANAQEMSVSFQGGRVVKATLVGTDPTTDVAVIKVDHVPDGVHPASFGSTDQIVVGDPVAAIGNPLGLSQTMTTGIVSALNRPVTTVRKGAGGIPVNAEPVITNAIQVDASINPGNSGGPLFDAMGRVIGINSTIATVSEEAGSVGLGFAIPSEVAQMVAQELITHGSVHHAFLGVRSQPGHGTTDGQTYSGAELMEIVPGTPAQKAGLKVGDVVVNFNGERVVSAESLTGFVRQHLSGDKVTIQIIRDGKRMDVTAELGEKESLEQTEG